MLHCAALDASDTEVALPWARAAEILRELPEAQVGVGPKPTTAVAVVEDAAKKAAR